MSFWGCLSTMLAQEYKVKAFMMDEADQSAVNNPRKDLIGSNCALVKLKTVDRVAKVDGNVIGDVQRKGAATWVYATSGTQRLLFHFDRHLSLSVIFSDYGTKSIDGGKTYILTLEEVVGAKNLIERSDTLEAETQYLLGRDYYRGENGQKQDYDKAYYWYSKSAAQGYANGVNGIACCYFSGRHVQKDVGKALELFKKAASMGSDNAMYNLGYQYYVGREVEKDYKKAVEWFLKGADAGHQNAQFYLGECYKFGYGVPKNQEKALYWYEKSAEQGNANAQYRVGNAFYFGHSVEKNYEKAALYFLQAASQGVADAMCNLGYCYEKGLGAEKSLENAAY